MGKGRRSLERGSHGFNDVLQVPEFKAIYVISRFSGSFYRPSWKKSAFISQSQSLLIFFQNELLLFSLPAGHYSFRRVLNMTYSKSPLPVLRSR